MVDVFGACVGNRRNMRGREPLQKERSGNPGICVGNPGKAKGADQEDTIRQEKYASVYVIDVTNLHPHQHGGVVAATYEEPPK